MFFGCYLIIRTTTPIKGLFKASIQSIPQETLTYNVNIEKPVLVNSVSNSEFPPVSFGAIQSVPEWDIFVYSPSSVPIIPTDTLKSYLQSNSTAMSDDNFQSFQHLCDENVAPMNFKTGKFHLLFYRKELVSDLHAPQLETYAITTPSKLYGDSKEPVFPQQTSNGDGSSTQGNAMSNFLRSLVSRFFNHVKILQLDDLGFVLLFFLHRLECTGFWRRRAKLLPK